MLFQCTMCDFNAESGTQLRTHTRKTHCKDQTSQTTETSETCDSENNKSEYHCFYCGFLIKCDQSLHNHQLECCVNHNSEKQRPSTLFATSDLTSTKVKCYTCHQQFANKRERRKHYDSTHMNMMLPFPTDAPCYTCDDILATPTDLRDHYNNYHPEILLYWCDVCLTNFGSDRGLKSHLRNSHQVFQ